MQACSSFGSKAYERGNEMLKRHEIKSVLCRWEEIIGIARKYSMDRADVDALMHHAGIRHEHLEIVKWFAIDVCDVYHGDCDPWWCPTNDTPGDFRRRCLSWMRDSGVAAIRRSGMTFQALARDEIANYASEHGSFAAPL